MNKENQPTVSQKDVNDIAWKACNKLRGPVSSDQYKDDILIMLFYKYISDVFNEDMSKIIDQYGDDEKWIQRKRVEKLRFVIPENSSFDKVFLQRAKDNIGEVIDKALAAIAQNNREKLEGIFKEKFF